MLVPLVPRDGRPAHAAHPAPAASAPACGAGRLSRAGASTATTGPVAAALRETEEETGIPPGFVEPLGFLDTYLTGTTYRVVPVVGMLRPGFTVTPHAGEVADIFEVPLAFLMNPAHHERHSREWQGKERYYYAMPWQGRYIWGATAGMIRNLYR